MVRRAFAKHLEFSDIYDHVTLPQEVCLLRREGRIIAMRSQNRTRLSGLSALILEGAAIDPIFHGKGIYGVLLSHVYKEEAIICLRTQNPHVYAGLEKFCAKVYPNKENMPGAVREIQQAFAHNLGCKINSNGVIKGYYGGLFYGEKPTHKRVSNIFETLGVDLENGDGLLVVGIKK